MTLGLLSIALIVSVAVGYARSQGAVARPIEDLKTIDETVFRLESRPSPEESTKVDEVPPSVLPAPVGAEEKRSGPEVTFSTIEIRTELPAVPGARMALDVDRGEVEGTTFRWTQIEGPTVAIEDPSRPSIQITLPAGTERLGFLLVAARSDRVRIVRVFVPVQTPSQRSVASVETPSTRASWGARPTGKVKADAGDDQVGLVGHRVTLNGSQSIPSDGKGTRWVQVAGPSTLAPQSQGLFFSFVPSTPGVYRFLLMVAADGELAEPDEVSVLVGSPPSTATATASTSPNASPAAMPAQPLAPPAPPTPEQILAANLPRLSDGRRVASEIADVLESISERATLYPSFDYLLSELSRRLDVVIPVDPAQRADWNQGIFAPLTAYTASQLLTAGINLGQPQRFAAAIDGFPARAGPRALSEGGAGVPRRLRDPLSTTRSGSARQRICRLERSQEGKRMRTPDHRGMSLAVGLLVASMMIVGFPQAQAQEQPATHPLPSLIGPALANTLSRGVPTVAVFTSETVPASAQLWNEFHESHWARINRGLVQVVHVSRERDAGFVRSSGVVQIPYVVVYVRGSKGVTVLSSIQDCPDAASLVARMVSLNVGMEPVAMTDSSVRPTAYGGDTYPSQQYQQPVQQQPVTTLPAPTQSQPTLTVAMPPNLTTTAGVIQVPGQSLMIQQQQRRRFSSPRPSNRLSTSLRRWGSLLPRPPHLRWAISI